MQDSKCLALEVYLLWIQFLLLYLQTLDEDEWQFTRSDIHSKTKHLQPYCHPSYPATISNRIMQSYELLHLWGQRNNHWQWLLSSESVWKKRCIGTRVQWVFIKVVQKLVWQFLALRLVFFHNKIRHNVESLAISVCILKYNTTAVFRVPQCWEPLSFVTKIVCAFSNIVREVLQSTEEESRGITKEDDVPR